MDNPKENHPELAGKINGKLNNVREKIAEARDEDIEKREELKNRIEELKEDSFLQMMQFCKCCKKY